MSECLVCKRIAETLRGENKYFVRELKTGYVVVGDYQRFRGYTVFICKQHAEELHQLEKNFRNLFLQEMAMVAEAVYIAYRPQKLNYELLGQGGGKHMHWHIFPRNEGDTPAPGPVWKLPREEMYHEKYVPSQSELEEIKAELSCALDEVLLKEE